MMLECRYYGICDNSDLDGGETCALDCRHYEPMPDVDALQKLADRLDKDADSIISVARDAQFTGGRPRMGEAKGEAYEWRCIARSIRKACGVIDDA